MLRFRNGKAIAAILALSSALALSAKVLAQEVSASKDVAITVYNQNFGLVKDSFCL